MPVGTGLSLCHEYICRGGSCQEHRGIMFLLAMLHGSLSPEWWLSKFGHLTQNEPEYSCIAYNTNIFRIIISYCTIYLYKTNAFLLMITISPIILEFLLYRFNIYNLYNILSMTTLTCSFVLITQTFYSAKKF